MLRASVNFFILCVISVGACECVYRAGTKKFDSVSGRVDIRKNKADFPVDLVFRSAGLGCGIRRLHIEIEISRASRMSLAMTL